MEFSVMILSITMYDEFALTAYLVALPQDAQ
jgi:hypothetical protein